MDARWMLETPTEPIIEVDVDARRSMRRAVEVPCELVSHYADDAIMYRISDLSPYGVWIDTFMPLHPGAEVVVCFRPPFWRREIPSFARVARIVTGRLRRDRGPMGMGLELTDLSFDERMHIAASLRGIPPRFDRHLASVS
jgi:PilZ domain